jgi:hypothetical protein
MERYGDTGTRERRTLYLSPVQRFLRRMAKHWFKSFGISILVLRYPYILFEEKVSLKVRLPPFKESW